MKKLLFVCFFGVVALNACKTAKSTKKSEAETKPTVTTESVIITPVISKDTIVKKDPGPKYDLIVSFFSIGAGIDGQSVKILDDFIVNFRKDKNVIINAPRISSAHLHIYTFALLLRFLQDGIDLNYKADQHDNRRKGNSSE